MNVPNAITFGRIALVPVFLVLAYERSESAAVAAFVVFLVASLSDGLDGLLARRWGIVTRTGQFMDPTADKLLVGGALLVLVVRYSFPLWAALVIAMREVAVQILRTRIVSAGGNLPASPMGKLKTVLQVVMVGAWLLAPPGDRLDLGHWIALGAVLVATVWSGIEYFLGAMRAEASA